MTTTAYGPDADPLKAALRRLANDPALPDASAYLAAHAEQIDADMAAAVTGTITAFSESANPDVLPEMAAHAGHHTRELVRLTGGGKVERFEFVRAHARRRAEQRFPLEATLHAYRCGHRVYSRWIRKALAAAFGAAQAPARLIADVTDFTLEYTDTVSTIATAEYVARTRLMADVAGDERARLMSILLDGHDESDGRVGRILREAGYLGQRLSFCIAVAQPVKPEELRNPARARRLADTLGALLARTGRQQLVDVRHNEVVAVVCAVRRLSGWTASRRSLADTVAGALQRAGNAVLIGVSNDAPSTAHLPRAHAQARLCLQMAGPSHRVVQFATLGMRDRMLHLCREELAAMLPEWSQALFDADDRSRGVLVATLRAYAEADMNVLRAARALDAHPNTVYARMDRVAELTRLEPRTFSGLTELLTVADCRQQA